MNDMISNIKSAMETFIQNKTSRTRKRNEMSDSNQSSDEESIAETAGKSLDTSSEISEFLNASDPSR